MKIYQNTFVLILFTSVVALSAIGCKGDGFSESREKLFSRRPLARSGHSAEAVAKNDSRPAKIDFHAAADAVEGSSDSVALASYVSQEQKENETQWLKSYDEAVQLSKQTGLPILADFTGSNWCGYCVKLKKEIFDTPIFKSWAAKNVVLLELDFPRPNLQPEWIKQQNNQLRSRYEITSYPTVLILNAEGDVMGSQGYMRGGPEAWIAVANNTVQANQALKKIEFVDAVNYSDR